jgi:phage anti-repressor protein
LQEETKNKKLKEVKFFMEHEVICQGWEEIEIGWGERPNGYTLHLDMASRNAFVQKMEESNEARKPFKNGDEFSQPDSQPYKCKVNNKIFKEIQSKADKNGAWFTGDPPTGKKSGWIPIEEALKQ